MPDIKNRKETVAVAMSGGVDSSVAAALLREQGHEVLGLTMRLFCYDEHDPGARSCCNLQSIEDARAVCERIGASHHVIDCGEEFREKVIDSFVDSYLRGSTPNPCVECNRHIKFSFLIRRALTLGASHLATGHYVRLLEPPVHGHGGALPLLARGADPGKDQSYFLWSIARESLGRVLFPVGGLGKREVRRRAVELGLSVSEKQESQEVCFMAEASVEDFIRDYRKRRDTGDHPATVPGPVVDTGGRRVGTHSGAAFYTLGQRRGLGVSLGRPVYVTAVDTETNTVVVGENSDLLSDAIEAASLNYLVDPPEGPFRGQVKVRYRQSPVEALVTPRGDGRAGIDVDRPLRAVTPGQSIVFYDRELVLGGGVIQSSGAAGAEPT